ncbi:uncharacterized protein LOC114316068 [Camellia sinensis]|uniref:uncharacterized protein LOC114316068 n=1 Tax=Camellia sinensis TaxID=4442 RepID=UPI001035AA41|nr:uncharacterized protein LOC114316068 [Camellia sinensis]
MGHPKPVAVDLLADLPADVDVVPAQSMPPPKPKRIKKAQPKTKATEVEAEDALPISQLVESKKTTSTSAKRSVEAQPSEPSQSKKPRSSSAMTSGSRIPKVPWRPEITLEDKPVLASDSTDDINVGVALSTALLLPGDLERNAKMSEYENYVFMLQRSVQMKKLEDQAEAATKPQSLAEEKAESAEAIKKVAEAEKKEAEDKKAQAEKELQDALFTKDAEIKAADEKAYAQDEEGDEVIPEAVPDTVPANIPSEVKIVEQTLQEIDAKIAVEKEAEVVSDLQIQQSGGEDP